MMKKNYLVLGLLLASAGTMVNAQQLSNFGFDSWKETSGSSINTSNIENPLVRDGVEPTGWNGGNVNQFNLAKNGNLCVPGTEGDNKYVVLTNGFVGLGSIGSVAPGFLALGNPWIYAETSMLSAAALALGDGGAYGGVEFTYKPDAVSFKYRRTAVEKEIGHVIAYLWNGTFKSDVPKKMKDAWTNPSIGEWTELEDVDRAVFGKEAADKVKQSGKLIASLDFEITEDAADWTNKVVDFSYVEANAAETPTKINVIASAGDYWTRANLKENSKLDIDDLKLVYYSTLSSLTIAGQEIKLEDGKYEYEATGSLPANESEVVAGLKGKFATKTVTIDSNNSTVTIVVANQGGEDVDGLKEHTYVVKYQSVDAVPEVYNGTIVVSMMGNDVTLPNQQVNIQRAADGKSCTFALYNFSLDGEMSLGDIVIENVTITEESNGDLKYKGAKNGLSLSEGAIIADVTLEGTEYSDGTLSMNIPVVWNGITIGVTFNGEKTGAGVVSVADNNVKVNGVAGGISVAEFNGNVFVYTVDGRLVANSFVEGNSVINLANGLYIVKAGNKAVKVVVK